jgi:hypothetical protein
MNKSQLRESKSRASRVEKRGYRSRSTERKEGIRFEDLKSSRDEVLAGGITTVTCLGRTEYM